MTFPFPFIVLAGPSREVFLQPPDLERMHEAVVEMQFPIRSRFAHEHGWSQEVKVYFRRWALMHTMLVSPRPAPTPPVELSLRW